MTGAWLSDRDRQVLALVSEVGLASARQIERACFPAGPGSALSATRRCRRVLARLTDSHHLRRLQRRIGGARSGSSGYLYRLGSQGRRALGLPGRGPRHEPGDRFIAHQLAISEIHVRLREAERHGRLSNLALAHEPACWRRFLDGHERQTLKPDLEIALTTADGWALRWWLEVDQATEHRTTLVTKCRRYERYWHSGAELQHHPVFPRVLWSVPNERRAAEVQSVIAEARLTPDLFVVTTAEATTERLLRGGEP